MQYALLVYSDQSAWERPRRGGGGSAACGVDAAVARLFEEMGKADPNAEGRELVAASEAKVVRIVDGERVVTDGPFAETKEQIGGLFVTDLPDLDEAIRIAALVPAAEYGSMEIRPIVETVTAVARGDVPRGVASCSRDPHPRPRRPRRSPRTRCRTHSRLPSSGGRATACRARPGAWIVATARNGAIDRIRRERTFARKAELLARLEELPADEDADVSSIPDERLALVFTCCHPALAVEARVALTLREVAGLATPEIARAFLVPSRRSRNASCARSGAIREAGIPFRVPPDHVLPERLRACCASLYLVFNEGYAATRGRRARAARAVRRGDPARASCSAC